MPDHGGLTENGALFTDLYELTMLQSYMKEQKDQTAVFELYFRSLPANRNFIVAAGAERVVRLLEQLSFTDTDIDHLATQPQFSPKFLKKLRNWRFSGDVYAVPEGTLVFPNEPLVQVVAPLPEAQLIETLVMNQINFASLAATKAARCKLAAGDRRLVDFGGRRAHGIDAALTAARSSYLSGFDGTSLVQAGMLYNIPIFGTMAHSYIQASESEQQAFFDFIEMYPGSTLLVDTYDTLSAVQQLISQWILWGNRFDVGAIRLDSGDLYKLASESRRLLNEAGLERVKIFASGGLNEFTIEELLLQGAPIDGFGIGTALAVSEDAPSLDIAYKLVEYAGQPQTKLSSEKEIYPGCKQVFRDVKNGRFSGDVITQKGSQRPGIALLQLVMQEGKIMKLPSLEESRQHAQNELSHLPLHLRQLVQSSAEYPVEIDEFLVKQLRSLKRKIMRQTRSASS